MPNDTSRIVGYDAFISYSQAVSGELAAALQAWLERFATPWYRPRSLRVFRDYTSLSASEDLWGTIEQALASSAHFILLASPEAAKSIWVNREVEWWRANRPSSDMYIVLTGGELRWDDERSDWDWQRTTSLPPAAGGMFSHEPLWVDLSSVQTVRELDRSNPVLLNSVAQLAAPLRGVDKDTLVGEHITYYRRARRQRRGGVVALSILTILAVVAAYIARVQANNATNQARIATSRVLAEAAQADVGSNLSLAQLLAVEAYQLNPDASSRSALFQAVTASPALVGYLNAGSTVSAVTGSGNGHYIVAGTQGGQVVRWAVTGFRKLVIARLGQAVTSVSVSDDGNTVAAANGKTAIVWDSKSGVRSIEIPHGQTADLTAVSPSGRFVLIYSSAAANVKASAVPGMLILVDVQARSMNLIAVTDPDQSIAVTMPSDRQAVVLNSFGAWTRWAVPTMTLTVSGLAGFGVKQYATALSPNGELITSSNGASVIPIWETEKSNTSSPAPDFHAASTGPEPDAIAISPNGHEIATAANGSLYVAPVTRSDASVTSARQLSGNSTINRGALAFVGGSSHLVSGSGSLVAFWNLDQLSRIAMQVNTTVPASCLECSAGWLSDSPDDKTAILSLGAATAQQVGYPSVQQELPANGSLYYGPTAWSPDGRRLFVATSAGIEVRGSSRGLPLLALWSDSASPDHPIEAISTSSDGKHVIVVGSTDIIEVRDAATGRVVKKIQGPRQGGAALGQDTGSAAVSGDGTMVAVVVSQEGIDLIDLQTGKISPISVSNPYAVAFGGAYLAVQIISGNETGKVMLWNLKQHDWAQPAASNYISSFSINSNGTILANYEFNDSVLLQEPDTGATIGSFDVASPVIGLPPPSLTFSNDGTRLLVAVQGYGDGFNGKLEDWDLSPNSWMRTACTTAGVGMTSAEWNEVVGGQAPAKLACDDG
jgi:WD40 repeat protein